MSDNSESTTLPLQPTLWLKVGLHLYCLPLREPLRSTGPHVIEVYSPVMTEKRRGRLCLALRNVLASGLRARVGDKETALESLNDKNTALFFDSFTALKNL